MIEINGRNRPGSRRNRHFLSDQHPIPSVAPGVQSTVGVSNQLRGHPLKKREAGLVRKFRMRKLKTKFKAHCFGVCPGRRLTERGNGTGALRHMRWTSAGYGRTANRTLIFDKHEIHL